MEISESHQLRVRGLNEPRYTILVVNQHHSNTISTSLYLYKRHTVSVWENIYTKNKIQ